MYEVYNTQTGESAGILSEQPYPLTGEFVARIIEQKRDEQGNLLYLNLDGEETTKAGIYYEGEETEFVAYPPVMLDAGPLYEWRELIPTPAEQAADIQRSLVAAVQNHLDSAARNAGYDDIKSAVTYADEPAVPKFQAEGQAFRAWRSLTWAACYAILGDVLDNKRIVPAVEELLAELPGLGGE